MGLQQMYERSLLQWLMVWKKQTTQDGFGGFAYSYYGMIECRYEAHQKMVTNNKGKEVLSYARVYIKEDLKVDDFVLLKETVENPNAKDDGDAYRIVHFVKNTGIKNKAIERIIYLGSNV